MTEVSRQRQGDEEEAQRPKAALEAGRVGEQSVMMENEGGLYSFPSLCASRFCQPAVADLQLDLVQLAGPCIVLSSQVMHLTTSQLCS